MPLTPEPRTWEERFNDFFSWIAVMPLSSDEKEATSKKIIADVQTGTLYWSELSLSVLIATFGLLQNSVAVIIGAMLIAPLLRPIYAVAFSMSTGHMRFFREAFLLLFNSMVLAIFLSAVAAYIIPLKVETSEILSRTTPNLLDFFVAITSAVIAFMSLKFRHLADSVAGVAIAAALVPPLGVVGIELSLGDYTAAWGALLLFLTNIVSIVIVGVVLFYMFGFSPHQGKQQRSAVRSVVVLCTVVGMLCVPLATSLMQISHKVRLQAEAKQLLSQTLFQYAPEASLSSLQVSGLTAHSAVLTGTVKLPESTQLYRETQEQITKTMASLLERDIDLQLEVLRTASIVSAEQQPTTEDRLHSLTHAQLREQMPGATIFTIEPEQLSAGSYGVKVAFTPALGEPFTGQLQQQIEQAIDQQFPEQEVIFFWVELPQQQPQTLPNEEERLRRSLLLGWEIFLKDTLPEGASVQQTALQWTATTEMALPVEYVLCEPYPEYRLCTPGMPDPEHAYDPQYTVVKPITLKERLMSRHYTAEVWLPSGSSTEGIRQALRDFEAQQGHNTTATLQLFSYQTVSSPTDAPLPASPQPPAAPPLPAPPQG
ncbi:TIGR00341 family protein [Candidatus Peribacteria bacterium]|nr:TIGR00341 family protein [Candidatus Peribacteria bacterium]